MINLSLSKNFKKTAKKRTLFFLICDVGLIILSVYLAFFLRFDGRISPDYLDGEVTGLMILLVIFSIPSFFYNRLYSFSWSYVSTGELVSLAKALFISFSFSSVSLFVLKNDNVFGSIPRSVLLISYFLVFLFCGGIRFAKRLYMHFTKRMENREDRKRTLIVGASDAGEQIMRSILSPSNNIYAPVGFVDDDPMKHSIDIHGFKVLGKIEDIPRIIKNEKVEEVIMALPSEGSKTIKRAVELARNAGVKNIKVVPSITEFINGEVTIKNIREVEVEDLLGRETVSIETKSIEDLLSNRTVLITGASGSIGSELSRQVAKFKPSLLVLLDQDETGIFNISKELKEKFPDTNIKSVVTDICEVSYITRVFNEFKPAIVFHAAAYKHVPLMEEHPAEAVKNNVFGTKTVIEAALENDTEKFIFISTDKAINPTSVMGATKRIGEMLCQSFNQKNRTKFISVRFGNVLGSRGSVVPIFKEQIKKGGPVEVTHPDMKRYFMVTSEACLLVMQAGAMGEGGEVFVLDMGEPVKIIDLAKEMIRLSGFEPDKDIPIVFTSVRPGEKLFEELLTAEEGTVATKNQKIFIAKLSRIDEKKLIESLEKLSKMVYDSYVENGHIKEIFKKIIPTYGKR